MSVDISCPSPVLTGAEGELVSVRITVEPRLLEDLLEALAVVSFPINPQIYHLDTAVEFPAYSGQLEEVRAVLARFGFNPAIVQSRSMLASLHSVTG